MLFRHITTICPRALYMKSKMIARFPSGSITGCPLPWENLGTWENLGFGVFRPKSWENLGFAVFWPKNLGKPGILRFSPFFLNKKGKFANFFKTKK